MHEQLARKEKDAQPHSGEGRQWQLDPPISLEKGPMVGAGLWLQADQCNLQGETLGSKALRPVMSPCCDDAP